MVLKEGCEVQLIEATSKMPFKEHRKGDEVYVEVEPDVEYFIRISKNGLSRFSMIHLCKLLVDEQDLGYYFALAHDKTYDPFVKGLWSRVNGVSTQKALKFAKPQQDGERGQSRFLLGNVQMQVFKGIPAGVVDGKDFFTSFQMKSVKNLPEEKALRSTEGTTSTEALRYPPTSFYHPGEHLFTITLNYCTTPGLIKAGILSKPSTADQRKRPASCVTPLKSIPKPKRIRFGCDELGLEKEHDLFDLTTLSEDEDEEQENE
jgi:hypothetical protein